ncbi:unnamed protein product [Nesidiocoris tenuis]|uniref:Uncharacterized protein n=1 Tax=Nesidiocoris tenuis TaxID=355587 RepID=A0A6H5GNZ6_9HEMI|nr:unnamed protein product [Nesidiocoris tenuis]
MNRYYEGYPSRTGALMTLPPPPLTDPGATWTSYQSEPVRQGERFKPERNRHGVNVQKMQWRNQNWVDGFPEMVSSMTIADVSPRFAVKRIILLYENAQYREAANFVNRLSHGTFKTILNQLPIDLFIEAMPHSVSILEALYAKVFLSSDCGIKVLRPESVLFQLVKLFAGTGTPERWLGSARKLLKVIVLSEPKLKKSLQAKRRALDKAVEGLGQHGLVGTTDESLMNLHDALKVEFQRLVDTYKTALSKLEELSLNGKKDGKPTAPVQASHQRQLTLTQANIQERLIKNKTLLNVVEPATANRSAAILLAILQRRVECDKDALFQFTQLRKELKVESEQVVAPLLMRYSHACDQNGLITEKSVPAKMGKIPRGSRSIRTNATKGSGSVLPGKWSLLTSWRVARRTFNFEFDYEFEFELHCEFDFEFDYDFEFLLDCEFDFDIDYEFKFSFHCDFNFEFDYEFEFSFHFHTNDDLDQLTLFEQISLKVLELMKEVGDDEDSSDISGYHSDSDSAIMMSGNSPYVTKRARHNFLTRSVRSGSNRSGRPCLGLSSSSSDTVPDRGEAIYSFFVNSNFESIFSNTTNNSFIISQKSNEI